MNFWKNKKGYEWWMVVIAIASFFLLGVLMTIYAGIFGGVSSSGDDRLCQLSAVANAYGKTATGGEIFKLDCPMDTITITKKDLENSKFRKQAKENIEQWGFKGSKVFDDEKLDEWVLNSIVAKQMARWWSNMGEGHLDSLFDNWWQFFGCGGGKLDSCKGWYQYINPMNWETYGPPKLCVIGTRIKFDETVTKKFSGPILSLSEWTQKNPIPNTKISYYEYLQDDTILQQSSLFIKGYNYDVSKPYVVIYVKIKKNMLQQVAAVGKNTKFAGISILDIIVTGINPVVGITSKFLY